MSIPESAREEKQKLYERLCVAAEDLGLARQYAQHLLKKGWHVVVVNISWTKN